MGKFSEQTLSHILILYTGGTIGMAPNETGLEPVRGRMLQLLANSPVMHDKNRAKEIAPGYLLVSDGYGNDIAYHLIEYQSLLDSSNMNQADWERIAKDIEEHYQIYDGFIVLQGTDTLAYTASALSFMLENIGKPVIVTGSQLPIFSSRTDGYRNLISSLYFAANSPNIHEVVVVFGKSVLRGNRVVKVDNEGFEAFISPNAPVLAELEPVVKRKYKPIINNDNKGSFTVAKNLATDITVISVYPGIQAEIVRQMLKRVKGAVLVSFGNGNVPSNNDGFLNVLREAIHNKVLIVNVTQCLYGSVSYDYETGAVLREIGIVPGYDMTLSAAFTKLAYVLKQDIDYNEKIRMMKTNLKGELTSNEE